MPRLVNATELVANYHARSVADCFGTSAISTSAIESIAAKGIQKMEALD